MKTNQKKAYIYALSAVLLWSTVASAFKISLKYFDSIQLLLYSSLISFIVIFSIVIIQGKRKLIFSYSKRIYIYLAILGFINPFAYYLILFRAYELLPAQEVQPLNYTWALTLTYLSVLILKHKLTFYDFLAGIICYIGVFIIATHGNIFDFSFTDTQGVFLALFSTFLWSIYWIYSTKLKIDPLIGILINFGVGLSFIFIWALWFSNPFDINVYGLLGACYVGIFEMGITFIFWLQAMKLSSDTSKIANLIFISPFLSLLFISLIVEEEILFSTLIGLIFIIIGLLIQQKKKKESL
ncbi:MAG: DMT family transporter [Campylobacteraceae bacterium]|nr:DMT family transporter [Campylobacteraceae bacterium]